MIGLVGPMVDGVVGPLPEGGGSPSTGPVYAGPEYDISIGGLGFNLWPDSERPYERATAKFRKDQLDIGQTAGDQSLTGYWTRGQAAFHGGAGIKYYDVTGDEETTTRYRDSLGVDPFTSLGEVSLSRGFEVASTRPAGRAAAPWPNQGSAVAVLDWDSPGVAKVERSGVVTTVTLTPAPVETRALASNSLNVFVAGDQHVYKVTGTSGVPYVTHGDGEFWANVWVAKSRLIMVDMVGNWFTYPLDSTPTTVTAAGDAVWRAGNEAGSWHLADTPAAVLVGRGRDIYALSVDDDGTFVSLAAPVVAAQLPPDESVRGLSAIQGLVAIATTKGVRLGEATGVRLGYGPLLVRGSYLGAPAYADERLWVANTEGVTTTVSLTAPIASRVWPYAHHSVGSDMAIFVNTANAGLVRCTSQGVEWLGDDLVPSGFVETGLHRFGTLERKKFQSVTVRAGGTGGTLRVTRVYVDGSEAPLHSFEVAEFSSVTIDLREDEPLELLGLRFSLERSATDPAKGPVFQGYQLRALPAPQRQRLIRLPLMLYDVERNAGTGRPTGNDGAAWRRLSALEALESSGGTHMYMDRRTDEIGEVFIESVEHVGVTSPKARTTGYGGIVFVTLRLLT